MTRFWWLLLALGLASLTATFALPWLSRRITARRSRHGSRQEQEPSRRAGTSRDLPDGVQRVVRRLYFWTGAALVAIGLLGFSRSAVSLTELASHNGWGRLSWTLTLLLDLLAIVATFMVLIRYLTGRGAGLAWGVVVASWAISAWGNWLHAAGYGWTGRVLSIIPPTIAAGAYAVVLHYLRDDHRHDRETPQQQASRREANREAARVLLQDVEPDNVRRLPTRPVAPARASRDGSREVPGEVDDTLSRARELASRLGGIPGQPTISRELGISKSAGTRIAARLKQEAATKQQQGEATDG